MSIPSPSPRPLSGRRIVVTRPSESAASLLRAVRRLGGEPVRLPGLSLHAIDDNAVREAWLLAQQGDLVIFSSPAAVRFAFRLAPWQGCAQVIAVGTGSARALQRHALEALVPTRQDSEGLLDLPSLQHLHGRRVALIGAPGGRGLLAPMLRERGAAVSDVHVYRRMPPRLDHRHEYAVMQLRECDCVLLSSGEALAHLQGSLSAKAWAHLCGARAVVSSERVATLATAAGFKRVTVAASADGSDLLAASSR